MSSALPNDAMIPSRMEGMIICYYYTDWSSLEHMRLIRYTIGAQREMKVPSTLTGCDGGELLTCLSHHSHPSGWKGQKYTLLSNKENLTLDGRKALKNLLSVNNRINIAYLLKESFGQLWSYQAEGWARRFFENWRVKGWL